VLTALQKVGTEFSTLALRDYVVGGAWSLPRWRMQAGFQFSFALASPHSFLPTVFLLLLDFSSVVRVSCASRYAFENECPDYLNCILQSGITKGPHTVVCTRMLIYFEMNVV